MSEEEIRNAVVKFDREDLLYGNYEIDIDTPIEVFITIKQMSKFINQQEEIQWYKKGNKHNQEIIIKQEQELQQKENIIKGLDNTIENLEEVVEHKENIIKEVRETLEEANEWVLGVGLKAILLEILDGENNDK